MQEKLLKSNIGWMIVFFFFGVIPAICLGSTNNDIVKIVLGIIVFSSVWGFIITSIGLIGKLNFNKSLSELPYNFDYAAEFIVYKNIGKSKKEKATKALKSSITIPSVYTEWSAQLTDRYQKIKDNENFYHYLKRCLRNAKKSYDILVAVLVPVEIGVMTVFLTNNGGQEGNEIVLLVSVVILAIILTRELYKCKDEVEFVLDVIDVLCPKFGTVK